MIDLILSALLIFPIMAILWGLMFLLFRAIWKGEL